jgi:hypothetical protein
VIEFDHGRTRLLFDPKDGTIRLTFDGRGLIDKLSVEERMRLSKAMWYSAVEANPPSAG